MRSMFQMGFFQKDVFGADTGLRPVALALAGAQAGSRLGEVLDAAQRAQLSSKIAAGTARYAEVQKWLAGRLRQDSTLINTFREQFIVDNFWGYDDLVKRDQYWVDLASQKLASSDPANGDFDEETISRVDEWSDVIGIMHAAMREYGGNSPSGSSGIVTAPSSKTSPILLVAGALGVVGLVALLARA